MSQSEQVVACAAAKEERGAGILVGDSERFATKVIVVIAPAVDMHVVRVGLIIHQVTLQYPQVVLQLRGSRPYCQAGAISGEIFAVGGDVVEDGSMSAQEIDSRGVGWIILVSNVDVCCVVGDNADGHSTLVDGDGAVGSFCHILREIILVVGGKGAFDHLTQITGLASRVVVTDRGSFLAAQIDDVISQQAGIFCQLDAIEIVVEIFVDISIGLTAHQTIIGTIICVVIFHIIIASETEEAETGAIRRTLSVDVSRYFRDVFRGALQEGEGVDSSLRGVFGLILFRSLDIHSFAGDPVAVAAICTEIVSAFLCRPTVWAAEVSIHSPFHYYIVGIGLADELVLYLYIVGVFVLGEERPHHLTVVRAAHPTILLQLVVFKGEDLRLEAICTAYIPLVHKEVGILTVLNVIIRLALEVDMHTVDHS